LNATDQIIVRHAHERAVDRLEHEPSYCRAIPSSDDVRSVLRDQCHEYTRRQIYVLCESMGLLLSDMPIQHG
jgi:hypothetical protein